MTKYAPISKYSLIVFVILRSFFGPPSPLKKPGAEKPLDALMVSERVPDSTREDFVRVAGEPDPLQL